MALILAVGTVPAGAAQLSDFTDVPVTVWYRSDLSYATAHNLIQGYSERTFRGELSMTRGMFITVLGRAFGEAVTPGDRFPDVENSQYYAPYVYWGAAHGIVLGREDGNFDPETALSRQEMAAMMARAAEKLNMTLTAQRSGSGSYPDAWRIASWAKTAVDFCWEYGLMQGDSEGFRPLDPVSRAEGMAVLVRFFKNAAGELGKAGPLQVIGTQLSDSSGSAVQLRGVSTHGLAWYPQYVNRACFQQLRDQWGVNVVRLAMYTAEYGGYCTGGDREQLKQLIRDGVHYAAELGMYVIVDWHVLNDRNPWTYQTEALAFFSKMSGEFAGYTNVLYEICNEPNGGTSWAEIKSYAETIIPAIRKNDPDAVILVGTPNWSQYVDQAAADPIRGYDNILYTLHFYADTHRDSLRNTMVTALGKGLPIFVSEYGICDAGGSGNINRDEACKWISLLDRYRISYVAWNLSNKGETSAILNEQCGKASGFSGGDLSPMGIWLYEMLTGKAAGQLPEVQPDSPEPPAGGVTLEVGNGLSCTAEVVNQWEENGKSVYQYRLTVQNGSQAACDRWTLSLNFSGNIALRGSWNGNFSVSGSVLTVSSADYNGNIPAGGSVGDIGFIVSGGVLRTGGG